MSDHVAGRTCRNEPRVGSDNLGVVNERGARACRAPLALLLGLVGTVSPTPPPPSSEAPLPLPLPKVSCFAIGATLLRGRSRNYVDGLTLPALRAGWHRRRQSRGGGGQAPTNQLHRRCGNAPHPSSELRSESTFPSRGRKRFLIRGPRTRRTPTAPNHPREGKALSVAPSTRR